MKYINVLGVPFINGTVGEAVEKALQLSKEHRSAYVISPDSDMLLEAKKDRLLAGAIEHADLCLPEGNGIICCAAAIGMPIKNRIMALDFASALMARMSEKGMSVFALGKDSETVDIAGFNITERYPGLVLAGSDDGYFSMEQDLLDVINEAKPDLLLVGYGSPEQEKWIYRNKDRLDVGLMLGFGEELCIIAGDQERAPKRWRDSGFEWLYRIAKDPKCIGRMAKRSTLLFTAIWRRIFD